jgi:hypothetical protein
MKYYGNEPIKERKEIDMIFDLYESNNIIHHQDMIKLKNYVQTKVLKQTKVLSNKAYRQKVEGALYTCGNCLNPTLFSGYKFCPDCGCEADWSEENE